MAWLLVFTFFSAAFAEDLGSEVCSPGDTSAACQTAHEDPSMRIMGSSFIQQKFKQASKTAIPRNYDEDLIILGTASTEYSGWRKNTNAMGETAYRRHLRRPVWPLFSRCQGSSASHCEECTSSDNCWKNDNRVSLEHGTTRVDADGTGGWTSFRNLLHVKCPTNRIQLRYNLARVVNGTLRVYWDGVPLTPDNFDVKAYHAWASSEQWSYVDASPFAPAVYDDAELSYDDERTIEVVIDVTEKGGHELLFEFIPYSPTPGGHASVQVIKPRFFVPSSFSTCEDSKACLGELSDVTGGLEFRNDNQAQLACLQADSPTEEICINWRRCLQSAGDNEESKLRNMLLVALGQEDQHSTWVAPTQPPQAPEGPSEISCEAAEVTGQWYRKTRHGSVYLHDGNTNKGSSNITWSLSAGTYNLKLIYLPNRNRASNVPVWISSGDGTIEQRSLNLKQGPNLRKHMKSLGQFTVADGGHVRVSNAGTNGYVAVIGLYVEPTDEAAASLTQAEASSEGVQILEANASGEDVVCMDPTTEDPESWMCDCYANMISHCAELGGAVAGDDAACLEWHYCQGDRVCSSWKRDNCEDGASAIALRAQHKSDAVLHSVDESAAMKVMC